MTPSKLVNEDHGRSIECGQLLDLLLQQFFGVVQTRDYGDPWTGIIHGVITTKANPHSNSGNANRIANTDEIFF